MHLCLFPDLEVPYDHQDLLGTTEGNVHPLPVDQEPRLLGGFCHQEDDKFGLLTLGSIDSEVVTITNLVLIKDLADKFDLVFIWAGYCDILRKDPVASGGSKCIQFREQVSCHIDLHCVRPRLAIPLVSRFADDTYE